MLVALPSVDIDALQSAIDDQLATLPRALVTQKALQSSKIIQVENRDQALEFANAYAPEHLIINTDDAESYVDGICNAGSVFLGRYTPESVGDYASGEISTLKRALEDFMQGQIMCCRRMDAHGCTVEYPWIRF